MFTLDAGGVTGLALPAGTSGTVTLTAEGFVDSTIAIEPGVVIPRLHPRPDTGSRVATGTAVIRGSLGADGANLVVSYRSASLTTFAGVAADASGGFTFEVPVTGTEAGVLLAASLSEGPRLALRNLTIQEGETQEVNDLVPIEAGPDRTFPPRVPTGHALSASRLALLVDSPSAPSRLDLLAFTVGHVPQYDLPGFTLASVFETSRTDGLAGSEAILTRADGGAFLPAPDLDSVPDVLAASGMLDWKRVPGATLYTLRLQRQGAARPIWEGATTTARIQLPANLPPALTDLDLEVDAWAAPDVSIYTVASLRALRLPATTGAAGGRRSWALRRGLGT